jgi:hypothetical protein
VSASSTAVATSRTSTNAPNSQYGSHSDAGSERHCARRVVRQRVVAEALQVVSYRGAEVTPMPGDQNSHTVMISRPAKDSHQYSPTGA